jgi:hypothetical protein
MATISQPNSEMRTFAVILWPPEQPILMFIEMALVCLLLSIIADVALTFAGGKRIVFRAIRAKGAEHRKLALARGRVDTQPVDFGTVAQGKEEACRPT